MSKTGSKRQRRAAALAESAGWMEILRLDKKGFEILSKKVNLKFDSTFPISDPVQRLIVTLRFLVTGEGYHDSLQDMFLNTFEKIFHAMDNKLEVRNNQY